MCLSGLECKLQEFPLHYNSLVREALFQGGIGDKEKGGGRRDALMTS